MADSVKPPRRYESPLRREQASATRVEILRAAEVLFLRDGYGATTMSAIAKEAGVALKTVYVAFETKAGLLRALWNARLRGRDDVPHMSQHPGFREALGAPDPEHVLRINARNSRLGKERIGMLADVIRAAAPLDADIGMLWQRINTEYHDNQRAVVERLSAARALARELDVDRATDILWTINHPSTWHLLVALRGWTADEYERWAADAACEQLLHRPRPG
jgi:AcrR family transcriptional regulator